MSLNSEFNSFQQLSCHSTQTEIMVLHFGGDPVNIEEFNNIM